MKVFSIADLHLSDGDKPMDVFGANWERHFERISQDWRERIDKEDLVLLPGDLSWAMRLEDALPHLEAVAALPGTKVILRGNHDYWWSAIGKVRAALPQGMYAVQNDAMRFGDVLVCGTRGWLLPGQDTTAQDRKIYERELIRFEMSLKQARALSRELPLIAMLHFPPFTENMQESGFSALAEEYGVHTLLYGHLHGAAAKTGFRGERGGVQYALVSCDALDFSPLEITLPE